MFAKNIIFCLLIVVCLIFAMTAHAREIGHTSVTFTDSARSRQIPAEIYYPAETAGRNVPVGEPDENGFPIISFGHGYLMPWSVYANIWTVLVPAGYIVCLPRTGGELFPDHEEFGLDLAYVIRALQAEGADSSSIFHEKTGQTSAVMGHSMGGGASVLAASSDSTITALANLAAAETNPSAIEAAKATDIPALLFAGSDDCVTPPEAHQIPLYNALASDCKTLVILTGGSHCQFAAYHLTCNLGESGCPGPGINRAEQHALVARFLLPWLAAMLKKDSEAWDTFESLLEDGQGITSAHTCRTVSPAPETPQTDMPSLFRCRFYPNPFNSQTTIEYHLPQKGTTSVRIYNSQGQCVWRQDPGAQSTGTHRLNWAGIDRNGHRLPSGYYICQLRWNGTIHSARLILLK